MVGVGRIIAPSVRAIWVRGAVGGYPRSFSPIIPSRLGGLQSRCEYTLRQPGDTFVGNTRIKTKAHEGFLWSNTMTADKGNLFHRNL